MLDPLIGEHLALDLVNTRPSTEDGRADLLGTPRLLAAWLARQPALQAEAGSRIPTAADLTPVHVVRDHVDTAVRALLRGTRPPKAALSGLTEAARAAPAVRELDWDGSTVTATPRRAGRLGARLAARLAEAAADLLTDPAIGTLRQCVADDCVMVFLPAHPRRRWCSPTRCGNRARVARYYQRHKTP